LERIYGDPLFFVQRIKLNKKKNCAVVEIMNYESVVLPDIVS
jgi:hypothetical protein